MHQVGILKPAAGAAPLTQELHQITVVGGSRRRQTQHGKGCRQHQGQTAPQAQRRKESGRSNHGGSTWAEPL
jgi:hypothetical protein